MKRDKKVVAVVTQKHPRFLRRSNVVTRTDLIEAIQYNRRTPRCIIQITVDDRSGFEVCGFYRGEFFFRDRIGKPAADPNAPIRCGSRDRMAALTVKRKYGI